MSNKIASVALERFSNLSHQNQALVMSEVFSSSRFEKFKKRADKKGKNPNTVASDFLRSHLAKHFEASTVYGRRLARKTDYDDDPLEPISVWMPNGRFAGDELGCYVPLGWERSCSRVTIEHISKCYYQAMIDKWDSIKDTLMSSACGGDISYVAPRLGYEPAFSDKQSVYFVLDKSKARVKIGVSQDIPSRMVSIKREYKTGELSLLSVIMSGGAEVEAKIHERLSEHRIKESGMGREWFEYNEPVKEFIKELCSYTVKSDYLEAVGIL